MVRIASGRFGLVAAVFAAVACASDPTPDAPLSVVSVTGVVTQAGAPLPNTTVEAYVWDNEASHSLGEEVTLTTDAAGRFETRLELDTLLVGTYSLVALVTPPFGSGLGADWIDESITFGETGRAAQLLEITIERVTVPVPAGPSVLLDPGRLVGHYQGRSVEPLPRAGGVELSLEIDSVGARPFGRFDTWFDATTGCGNVGGIENLIDGALGADTLHLRLLAGISPSGPPPKVQNFLVTSHDAANDTLILHYPPGGGGDCSWGYPAPLRLVRQLGP
jgi:hypothetical protein